MTSFRRWYDVRVARGESVAVNQRLEQAVRECMADPAGGGVSGHNVLSLSVAQKYISEWGNLIRDGFTARNAHLTVPRGCSGGSVGEAVAAIQRQLNSLQRAAQLANGQAALSATDSKVGIAHVLQLLQGMSIAPAVAAGMSIAPAVAAGTGAASHSGGAAARLQHGAGSHATAAAPRRSPVTAASQIGAPYSLSNSPLTRLPTDKVAASAASVAASVADVFSESLVDSTAALGSLGNLRHAAPRPLSEATAMEIAHAQISHLKLSFGTTPQDASRIRAIVAAFRAMATPTELRALEPAPSSTTGTAVADGTVRDEGARLAILANLDTLIRLRLQALLADVGITARSLQGTKPLAANSIADRVRDLNDARKAARPPMPSLKCDEADLRSDFVVWRQRHETAKAASAARPLAKQGKPRIADAALVSADAVAAPCPAPAGGVFGAPVAAAKLPAVATLPAAAEPAAAESAAAPSHAGTKRRRTDDSGPQSQARRDDAVPSTAEPAAAGTRALSGGLLGMASSSAAMFTSWMSQSASKKTDSLDS